MMIGGEAVEAVEPGGATILGDVLFDKNLGIDFVDDVLPIAK